jgi:hypothetical protein
MQKSNASALIVAAILLVTSCNKSKKDYTATDPCGGDSPILYVSDLGDKYRMVITGTNKDIVEFWYENERLAVDPIRGGDCMTFYNRKPSRINENLHIFHIQFGNTREDGNIYAYAIVGRRVFRSPVWKETAPGDEAKIELIWNGVSGTIYSGFTNTRIKLASFTFDTNTYKWSCLVDRDGICVGAETSEIFNKRETE